MRPDPQIFYVGICFSKILKESLDFFFNFWMNPFIARIYLSNVVHLPQNGLESLVVRYNGPRSFDCDAENPIVTQLESVRVCTYENKSCEKTPVATTNAYRVSNWPFIWSNRFSYIRFARYAVVRKHLM